MSEENIYLEYFDALTIRIGFLNGSMYHLSTDLTGFEKLYKESRKNTKDPDFRLGSRLAISDVSNTDKKRKVYATKGRYVVKLSDHKEYNIGIINEFASFVILQSYESFRHFLKSVISTYYSSHPELLKKHRVVKPKNQNIHTKIRRLFWSERIEQIEFAEIFSKINVGKLDSRLFSYLRKLSEHYKDHEKSNNRNINFHEFHKVYAICRHSITHKNSIIEDFETKDYTEYQNKVLDYFSEKDVDSTRRIKLNQRQTTEILTTVSEHAYLIFKSLSILEGFDWKIFETKS